MLAACTSPSSAKKEPAMEAMTHRFVLVRHAEKDTGDNPGLTAEGTLRAQRLADMLQQEKVTAIFSTDYRRTLETVGPLSKDAEISTQKYQPMSETFIPSIFTQYPEGGLFVIAGHSNTIPALVNQLVGSNDFEQLGESDYNDVFIVQASAPGTGSCVQITY